MFKTLAKHLSYNTNASSYVRAKRLWQRKIAAKDLLLDLLFISAGICSAAFGLKGFLLPNAFIDGGATGISLLVANISKIDIAILIVAVNLPFVIFGYTVVDKTFAIKTACSIVVLALALHFIPFAVITNDSLLVSVFGGFFLGLGIGLAMRGGAVIDGTEVLAIVVSRRTGASIGDVILVINIIIFSLAAWLLSIHIALYAILTYLSAAKTVDFVIEGIEEYTGVTIVSLKDVEIGAMISSKMGRGFTVYNGERGVGRSGEKFYDMKIIYSIVTRLEVNKLKLEIEKIDPNAFVIMTNVKDMKGGMIKKRRLH